MSEHLYITQYALSGGITFRECEPGDINSDYFYIVGNIWSGGYRLGKECFRSKTEALADAEARRVKKIASLKKQIEKLERKTFDKINGE